MRTLNDYRDLKARLAALNEEMLADGPAMVASALTEALAPYPDVTEVSWYDDMDIDEDGHRTCRVIADPDNVLLNLYQGPDSGADDGIPEEAYNAASRVLTSIDAQDLFDWFNGEFTDLISVEIRRTP